jgi:acyl-CoA synthetase (NDP forming)
MSSKGAPSVLAHGPRGKIPSYSFPENAALALSASLEHAHFRARPTGRTVSIPRAAERAIRALVENALAGASETRVWLSSDDLATVLKLAGIRFAEATTTVPTPDAAARASDAIGYPVVLKAIAKGLVHKTDVGGVAVGLDDRDAVLATAATMQERVGKAGYGLEGFLVQRQIDGGIESLVGVTSDPGLGPIIVAGLGGVQVELFGDAAFRLPPVSDVDAREMIERIKAKKLLDGFRGAPPGDKDALADVICRISALVEIVPEITELDLNPVKVLPPGKGAVVVDGRLRLEKPTDPRRGL